MPNEWIKVPLAWGGSLRFLPAGAGSGPSGLRLWAGSIALCGALQIKQGYLGGRRALEFGAGCGLAGLYAAALGCQEVVLSDTSDAALTLLKGNAQRYEPTMPGAGPQPLVRRLDFQRIESWHDFEEKAFHLVLASELLYDRDTPAAMMSAIDALLAPNGSALVSNRDRPLPGAKVRDQMREEAERRGLMVEDLDADSCFEAGLKLTGIEKELLTGVVDASSVMFYISRRSSNASSNSDALNDDENGEQGHRQAPQHCDLESMD